VGLLLLPLVACTPADDWREMRPAQLGLQFSMPCRPLTATRQLPLAGTATELTLMACDADGQTFALASAELGDPARVGAALDELARAAQANVQGRVDHDAAAEVDGMTPNPAARNRQWTGRRPDGQPVTMTVLVFARGTRVYQATTISSVAEPARDRRFFDSIKVNP
jgi:hypothetical protein